VPWVLPPTAKARILSEISWTREAQSNPRKGEEVRTKEKWVRRQKKSKSKMKRAGDRTPKPDIKCEPADGGSRRGLKRHRASILTAARAESRARTTSTSMIAVRLAPCVERWRAEAENTNLYDNAIETSVS